MNYRKYIIKMVIKLTNLNKMYLYTLSTSDLLKLKNNVSRHKLNTTSNR